MTGEELQLRLDGLTLAQVDERFSVELIQRAEKVLGTYQAPQRAQMDERMNSEPELLSSWELSVRCWNALYHGGIVTVDDLKQTDRESLLRMGNFGKVSLAELMAEAQLRGIDIAKRRPENYARRWPNWHSQRPTNVQPQDYQPAATDAMTDRIERLEARVAELEAMLWGRMAA